MIGKVILYTQESNGTQEKILDDVQKRMATTARVQVCVIHGVLFCTMPKYCRRFWMRKCMVDPKPH